MRVILIIIFNVLLTNVFCALPMSPDNLGILQLKQEVEAKSLLQVEASQEQAAASQGFEKKIIITEDLGTYSSIKHLKKISPELLKDFSSDKIPYFGHRLFKKLNLELSKLSLETSNIPDDYTIGVGDRFSIHVWNQTQDQIVPVSVNSLGVIKFPLAGEIFVKGVLKSQLRSYLLKNLSKFYKTLNLSFEFIKLRQFPVYVTGEVRSPGVYMANAMSTPLQLIIGAGGPTLEGSLRSIELINGSKTLATIDFYKYLLTGKLKRKLFLKAGNSLHIPLASKTIAVLGQVKRPGIFELKAWEKLSHLLSYAGGVLSDANTSSLQLIRFVTDGRAQLRDINFSKNKKFTLSDGDVLLVHPRLEEIQNRVQISGNIYRPGIYEWTKKLDLLTLIERAQGLKKETYLDRVEIYRLKSDQKNFVEPSGLKVISNRELIVKKINSASKNFYLKEGDEIIIFHLSDIQNNPTVSVSGEVRKPGDFPLNWNTKVKDILILAKLGKDAHMDKGEIYRESKNGMEILRFDVKRALENSLIHNMRLKNHDKITIFKDPNRVNQGVISLKGEIPFPGQYSFKMGDTLIQVLKRAGGLTKNSYLPASKFFRKSVAIRQKEMKAKFVKREKENLGNMQAQLLSSQGDNEEKTAQMESLSQVQKVVDQLDGTEVSGRILLSFQEGDQIAGLIGSEVDISLENGDQFIVSLRPTEVSVSGQVYSPLTELYRSDASLQDYLLDAGGLTEYAHKDKIYIIKASGKAIPAHMIKRSKKSKRYIGKVNSSQQIERSKRLDPGDFIVVPTRIKLSRNRAKETLESVYKMAITVGALGGLFK